MVGEYGPGSFFFSIFRSNPFSDWLNPSATSPNTSVVRSSTWKLEVVGSIPGLVKLTIINCLSDETLNRGPVLRCYTPSTLNQSVENAGVAFFKGANERNKFFEKK